jgi:hypothetical protein
MIFEAQFDSLVCPVFFHYSLAIFEFVLFLDLTGIVF